MPEKERKRAHARRMRLVRASSGRKSFSSSRHVLSCGFRREAALKKGGVATGSGAAPTPGPVVDDKVQKADEVVESSNKARETDAEAMLSRIKSRGATAYEVRYLLLARPRFYPVWVWESF
jgi:hypothetical protein